MSIHKLFGNQNAPDVIQLRPDLLQAVRELMDRHQRSMNEIANELIEQALHEQRAVQRSLHVWRQLTQREREITALIWLGLLNPQIAERLGISPHTVRTHVKHILIKFNVPSKKHLFNVLDVLDLSDWIDIEVDDPPAPTSSD